jgi:hypothetical protein
MSKMQKKPECEVRVIPELSKDGWLEIPWSLPKWQVSALLKGYELPFCDESDLGLDDGELYVIDPFAAQEVEHFPPLSLEEVLKTCVIGEYSETVIEGIPMKFLLVENIFIYFREIAGCVPSPDLASLCCRLVTAIYPMQ